MQAITEVHDVGGYISFPAPLIKLQHSICCFLVYSFGDNIMQKTIAMSFFVNHMYFYLTYALKNLHVHLLYSSVILCVVISQVLKRLISEAIVLKLNDFYKFFIVLIDLSTL